MECNPTYHSQSPSAGRDLQSTSRVFPVNFDAEQLTSGWRDPGVGIAAFARRCSDLRRNWPKNLLVGFHFILGGNQFMCHSASTGSAVPFRVQAYVETIVHTCADGGRALVSVVLFGSAAIGGWVETVSDVDLILVVPDCATDEDTDRLRR